jgi:DNA-binding NarL/FixJ family response regulator
MPRITVVIAETAANRATCAGVLSQAADIAVVAEAGSREAALAAVTRFGPRILVCGDGIATMASYSLLRTLRQKYPATLAILLTDAALGGYPLAMAVANGAAGVLSRDDAPSSLVLALRCVDAGEGWLTRKTVGHIADRLIADRLELTRVQ